MQHLIFLCTKCHQLPSWTHQMHQPFKGAFLQAQGLDIMCMGAMVKISMYIIPTQCRWRRRDNMWLLRRRCRGLLVMPLWRHRRWTWWISDMKVPVGIIPTHSVVTLHSRQRRMRPCGLRHCRWHSRIDRLRRRNLVRRLYHLRLKRR